MFWATPSLIWNFRQLAALVLALRLQMLALSWGSKTRSRGVLLPGRSMVTFSPFPLVLRPRTGYGICYTAVSALLWVKFSTTHYNVPCWINAMSMLSELQPSQPTLSHVGRVPADFFKLLLSRAMASSIVDVEKWLQRSFLNLILGHTSSSQPRFSPFSTIQFLGIGSFTEQLYHERPWNRPF